MVATLHASIKHIFWHDVWTNAIHDDRDFSIARMLVWQEMRMAAGADWPFKGDNLNALLVMGRLPSVLQSVPFWIYTRREVTEEEMEVDEGTLDVGVVEKDWLEHYDPMRDPPYVSRPSDDFQKAVRLEMVRLSKLIIWQLTPSERQSFQLFWADTRKVFIQEYERRCEYNLSLA
jgi:hypothetical protein